MELRMDKWELKRFLFHNIGELVYIRDNDRTIRLVVFVIQYQTDPGFNIVTNKIDSTKKNVANCIIKSQI